MFDGSKELKSEIRDGIPWTNGDDELVTALPDDVCRRILHWIRTRLCPSEKVYRRYSSYGIKHMLEEEIGIYLTNNQFKHAMVIAGYMPEDEHKLNWQFFLDPKSPTLQVEHNYW